MWLGYHTGALGPLLFLLESNQIEPLHAPSPYTALPFPHHAKFMLELSRSVIWCQESLSCLVYFEL